ncbi:type II toxin-antitoxin system RelE/ParE family toxin [Mucilaginibacter sp.]|uniref:type II toxin-antitoxin system RelE/ParE family toxin n=1 Tax=Mucilaginibacter sp. TaxID=1882438 RepID=UPI003D0F98C9
MTYSYVLRQEALEEFTDAYIWYEEQREGLGKLFSVAIYNKLIHVCNNPLHYKASYKNFHEARADKFPFLIVYTINKELEQITVLAIFHTSRNPKNKLR